MSETVRETPAQTALAGIRTTLQQGLDPVVLELEDESHKHAGHAGVAHDLKGAKARPDGGITHLRLKALTSRMIILA